MGRQLNMRTVRLPPLFIPTSLGWKLCDRTPLNCTPPTIEDTPLYMDQQLGIYDLGLACNLGFKCLPVGLGPIVQKGSR